MGINPSNAQVAQILQQLKSGQEDESLNLIPVERFEEVGSCQHILMPWQAWSMMWCSHSLLGQHVPRHHGTLPGLIEPNVVR